MSEEKNMRNYVVLKKHPGENLELWNQITAQYASSPKAAIRQVISSTNESGVYIAVPARSWVKQTVEIETKAQVKFS